MRGGSKRENERKLGDRRGIGGGKERERPPPKRKFVDPLLQCLIYTTPPLSIPAYVPALQHLAYKIFETNIPQWNSQLAMKQHSYRSGKAHRTEKNRNIIRSNKSEKKLQSKKRQASVSA